MFEYCEKYIAGDDELAPYYEDTEQGVVQVANEMALENWELVCVITIAESCYSLIFKRKR